MIRRILFVLFLGLLIAAFGLIVMREPGFAVFSYGDTTIEFELIKFYFAAVIVFLLLYLLFRLIGALYRLPGRLHVQRQHRRLVEILQGIQSSVMAAVNYNLETAVHNVVTQIKSSPIKATQHILAAWYAHTSGNSKLRQEHLTDLRKSKENNELADLLEAEFALDDHQLEKALSLLRGDESDSILRLQILARAHMENGDAASVNEVLHKLHIHTDKAKSLFNTVTDCLGWLIGHYDENANSDQLPALWKTYAKFIGSQRVLLRKFVRALGRHHADELAEKIIINQLKNSWDEQLVQEFGLLTLDENVNQIKQAEAWLSDHKESAGLYLTLGRLYKREKLWGKAKSFLESSLSRKPLTATYAELAALHEFLDEPLDAQRCAKKGLHIATRE